MRSPPGLKPLAAGVERRRRCRAARAEDAVAVGFAYGYVRGLSRLCCASPRATYVKMEAITFHYGRLLLRLRLLRGSGFISRRLSRLFSRLHGGPNAGFAAALPRFFHAGFRREGSAHGLHALFDVILPPRLPHWLFAREVYCRSQAAY